MESEDKRDEEEMDSLFEGMVLFNPSQLAPSDQESRNADHDRPLPQSPHHIESPSTACASSEPLDENLFSDLTLVTPHQNLQLQQDPDAELNSHSQYDLYTPQSPDSTPAASASTQTRQLSRRKKRAGLKIGYARDARLPDSDPNTTSSSPSEPHIEPPYLPSPSRSVGDLHPPPSPNTPTPEIQVENKDRRHDDDVDDRDSGYGKIEQIEARIFEKIDRARQLVASVSAARKDSIRYRRKADENFKLATLKHAHLEKQLEEACEAEDFERAETVSESLAAAEKEKQSSFNALREADAQIDAIDSKMQQVLNSQIAAEEECAAVLESFTTDAVDSAEQVLKKAEAMSSNEMEEWFSSNETLGVKRMELEIESLLVNESRIEFNKSIDGLVEDDKREKEILCKRKDLLLEELEELLALVKQKEQEIAENESKIEALEKRIANAVSDFQEMQSSIDSKYNKLKSALDQVDLDSKVLSVKKEEIDQFLSQEGERGAKLKELARESKEKAKAYWEVVELRKKLMSSALKSMEDKLMLAKTEEKLSGDVKTSQQEVSAARASLQELSSRKSSIQQNIASFKQSIFFLDKRVPELEAEKKVAAAARNFKEAGRIAAEAKSLSVEKDGLQNDMKRATVELEMVEEEIKDTLYKLQENEEMILSREKELAMARFKRLLLIASAATAERSAALELGDMEEANLLLAEVEAADSEAKKLQAVYDLKVEDVTNLPEHFISIELISHLGRNELAKLAESLHITATR